MNDRNLDDTRQPPDEIEARFCDECGQEMELKSEFFLTDYKHYHSCINSFCPSLYDGMEKEMAEKLVETLDTLSRVEARVKFLSQKLRKYEKE